MPSLPSLEAGSHCCLPAAPLGCSLRDTAPVEPAAKNIVTFWAVFDFYLSKYGKVAVMVCIHVHEYLVVAQCGLNAGVATSRSQA